MNGALLPLLSRVARHTRLARAAVVVGAAALSFASSGCAAEYDHTDITVVRPPPGPLEGSVNHARVQVSVGAVVTAHIVSYDDDHEDMSVELRPKDRTVVEVANVVSEHDYAFLGLRPGVTDVELLAGGKLVLIFTAVVVDQPAAP